MNTGIFAYYLPLEVIDDIFSLLSIKTLFVAQYTSKYWYLRCWATQPVIIFDDRTLVSITNKKVNSILSRTSISKLRSISFLNCSNLDEKIIPSILNYYNINSLTFQGCEQMDMNKVLEMLSSSSKIVKSLRSLEISLVWKSISQQGWESLQKLTNLTELRYMVPGGLRGISYLSTLPQLKLLRIPNSRITRESSEILARLTQLTNLQLPRVDISVEVLRNMNNLISLDLEGVYRLNDVSTIRDLTQLEELILKESLIYQVSSLQDLTNLKNLKKLSLKSVPGITLPGACDLLTPLMKLKELDISLDPSITVNGGVLSFKSHNFANIEKLNLSHQSLSINSILSLSHLFSLKHLNLSASKVVPEVPTSPRDLYLQAVGYLSTIYTIESLNIETWEISFDALNLITKLYRLNSLSISVASEHNKEDEKSFGCLGRLAKLKELRLVSQSDFIYLPFSQLSQLLLLSLSTCPVSDQHLEGIEVLPLTSLYLDDTNITDITLSRIQYLISLENLCISNCRITPDGIGLYLNRLSNLQKLRLLGTELNWSQIENLSKINSIHEIEVDYSSSSKKEDDLIKQRIQRKNIKISGLRKNRTIEDDDYPAQEETDEVQYGIIFFVLCLLVLTVIYFQDIIWENRK